MKNGFIKLEEPYIHKVDSSLQLLIATHIKLNPHEGFELRGKLYEYENPEGELNYLHEALIIGHIEVNAVLECDKDGKIIDQV